MKKYFAYSCALVAIFAFLSSCQSNVKDKEVSASKDELEKIYADYKAYIYHTYPEFATYNGIHDYDDRLTDYALRAQEDFIDSIKQIKNKINKFNVSAFNDVDALNFSLFKYVLNSTIDQDQYDFPKFTPLNQQSGLHIEFLQILNYQPLESPEDVDKFFSRLRHFKNEMYKIIDRMHEGIHEEVMLPKRIVEQMIKQVDGILVTHLNDFPLYVDAIEKSAIANRKVEFEDILTKEIYPAYQELYDFLVDEYFPAAKEDIGISNTNGGDKYYEYLARDYTTSNLSPEQIFKIGNSEVERIKKEMIALVRTINPNLSLEKYMNKMKTDPSNFYTDEAELLEGYRVILKKMDSKLPELFGTLPNAPYELKEIEAFRAESAPAAYYYVIPEDGSRPGYFYVNTYDLPSRPKHVMTALALHEAVPGHHLQLALEKEMNNLPWFRKNMQVTAFVEGWGLYAERLGYEVGMYEDDIQRFGALNFEMWRACRLVVDVGIHYMNWTFDEAYNFMKENIALSDLDLHSELNRYIAWPGQALAYKIGELKILELRSAAEEKLGDKFDVKAFHDELLNDGSLPLNILESKMQNWLDEQ